jgi:hypothetical protein
MNEGVGLAVSIAGNQVVGVGPERDEAAIGADRGTAAEVVALIAGGIDADPLGRPGPAIMNEGIGLTVGIAGNQVVGVGRERDVATVGGDRGTAAAVVALIAGGVDADPLGRPGPAIMNEGIGLAVGVAGNQVVGK